ncbi:E3 ubiquitin-protein ligase Zswim2 [Rhypophila decipiens]|uniref:E3 ubiquitin-protein ligase Zswim2 n=1 Tax=Rhypophila decipiens TaxID=261697 RepID=A0AAN6Y246_9PEZI|nr:E3 ubiquitin-protein ligase Zswim2 [Rhypophila decipiens]
MRQCNSIKSPGSSEPPSLIKAITIGTAAEGTPSSGRKRKVETSSATSYYDDEPSSSSTPTKKPKKEKKPSSEKRLRRYRDHAPQSFDDVYHRATTQRFYVLSRTRGGTAQEPTETVEMTGSTGNIYTVVVDRQPTCDCPQGRENKQCKHIVYVLARVLHARHEYVYQLALLSTELQEIFASAPPPLDEAGGDAETNGKRKPVEGDCPICFSDMEEQGREKIVWCRAACGQNIHKECFEMWATTKRQQGGANAQVTCPYCRSVWEGDEDMVKKIQKTGGKNQEGYVNVATQLGISQTRDHSTYSRWWSGHSESYRGGWY